MMKTLDKEAIRHLVEEEDIEFIRLQFVDLSGGLKNIAVTRKQLDALLEGKISLDGAYYDSENASLRLVPDLSTFAIFPWRPQTGKVAGFMCDLYGSDGHPVETDSRNILKWIIEDIRVRFRSDLTISPKIEFFLFDMDENGRPAVTTDESAGLMDVSPLDTGENAEQLGVCYYTVGGQKLCYLCGGGVFGYLYRNGSRGAVKTKYLTRSPDNCGSGHDSR